MLREHPEKPETFFALHPFQMTLPYPLISDIFTLNPSAGLRTNRDFRPFTHNFTRLSPTGTRSS